MYHGAEANLRVTCPVCGACCDGIHAEVLPVHLNHSHGAPQLREPPAPAWAAFSLVVCRSGPVCDTVTSGAHPRPTRRYLLVNEPAGICKGGRPAFWLPAGRLDAGEGFIDAAKRECEEEAGLAVEVLGVLSFHLDKRGTPRLVLLAQPLAAGQEYAALPQPKTVPDFESCGALWVDTGQLAALAPEDLRSPDPARLFPRVDSGELLAQPVDTPAFELLESVTRRLTSAHGVGEVRHSGSRRSADNRSSRERASQEPVADFATAWAALKDAYPSNLFA